MVRTLRGRKMLVMIDGVSLQSTSRPISRHLDSIDRLTLNESKYCLVQLQFMVQELQAA